VPHDLNAVAARTLGGADLPPTRGVEPEKIAG